MIGLDEAARLAAIVLDLRRRRADHLPDDLFGEAAWGLLLAMFVADAKGERLDADEACRRAGATPTTARRWLAVLEERGLIASHPHRGAGMLVSLTPTGVHAVEACMEDARMLMGPRPLATNA